MRILPEEWWRFIPGVRMYEGKKTLFYNGEKLVDWDNREYQEFIYNEEERDSWQVIIILPGVEDIPGWTFNCCTNLKTVIMADTIKRIESHAFNRCQNLEFVKLSRNVEYIGYAAFCCCFSLTSIFIPPFCLEISNEAFRHCKKLIILNVPQDNQFGIKVIYDTALIKASHFEVDRIGRYTLDKNHEVNEWIIALNQSEELDLHRECASCSPSAEIIYKIIKREGFPCLNVPNEMNITPNRYLAENPYNEIDQQKIINKLVLEFLGEVNTERIKKRTLHA